MSPSTPLRGLTRTSGLLLIGLLLAGCSSDPHDGWSMAWTHPERYRSITVPMFANDSWTRGLETELGRALVTEIEASTPWKITGPGSADTMLRGTIRETELLPLSTSLTTGLAQEMLFRATIDFDWVDLATGESIVRREGFSASAVFFPSRPGMESVDLARFGVVRNLAVDLVDALRDDW
jgi:hypothetical protein